MALFGQGDPGAALDVLQRGFDEAHGYLDIDAVRAFGTAASLCHLAAGDHAAVDDLLEVIFSAESPHRCRPECSSRCSRSPPWSPSDEGR